MNISGAAIAMLMAFLISGCATFLTLDAIDPGDEEDKYDTVYDVPTAWRDGPGNVTLCVTGMPAGANYWVGSARDFSIRYPGASSPSLEVFYHDSIPQYRVTAADVKGNCAEAMKEMTALPIHRIHAREFGEGDYSEMSDEALAEFFENRADAPAIYMFDYRFGKEFGTDLTNIVYVHEAPLHKNARAVEIATGMRKVEGEPGYVLLLPFALAFDVVTFPVQLLFALTYHG